MSIQDPNMQQAVLRVGKGIKTDFLFNHLKCLVESHHHLSEQFLTDLYSSWLFCSVLCRVYFPPLMQGKFCA